MTARPKVHILLPVHNRCAITAAFVDRLKKQTHDNFNLILIDDGSTDGTEEEVRRRLNELTVIRGKGNWWWGGSLQQGHDWLNKNGANSDLVLVMNDDTAFDEDFIATGVRIVKDNPRTLLTATGYNLKTRKPQDSGGYKFVWETLGCLEMYECSEMNCLSTRGLITRVSDFLSIGGFYPKLVSHYLSDLEFTMRGHEKGLKLMIHKDFKIYIDFEATGTRELGGESFLKYLKKVFSKRAAMNPVYWSNFIMLRCPKKYRMKNLKIIWGAVWRQAVAERLLPELKRKFKR